MNSTKLKQYFQKLDDWIGVAILTLLLAFAIVSLMSIAYYIIIFSVAFFLAARIWSYIKETILNKK